MTSPDSPFALVLIGTSIGGLSALKKVIPEIPESFTVPIVIVQHRHQDSDDALSQLLQRYSALPICDVEDKEEILPGQIYIAPADYHLMIEAGHFALSIDEPVSFARPSIDVLFESAAEVYRHRVIGVLLTGANQDGAKGLATIKVQGGFTIVQDPATAESPTMPESAIALTLIDQVLPLSQIAACLVNLCDAVRE
jgi:two-component system, chemotaxis family, protein-glutamate methylesterase/glutaminase